MKHFLICLLAAGLLWGCDSSEKNLPEKHPSPKQESQVKEKSGLSFFGVNDQLVRFGKLDTHVNGLDLTEKVSAIARDGDRFWAGCTSGKLHNLEILSGNDTLDTLKVVDSFDLGCKISSLTPSPGRLWINYKDCKTKRPTIAEFNTETRQIVARHVLGYPSDLIEQILIKDKYLYVLVGNTFSLIRLPLSNPAEQQILDLREGSTGKYGKGDAAFAGNQLWIFDSGKQQLMNVDIGKFSVTSVKSFAGFKAAVEPRHCVGGSNLLYCWSGKNILAFDPNGTSLTGTYTAENTIKHTAVIGRDVYIGSLESITQLAGSGLNLVKDNPGYYSNIFIGVQQ